MSHQKWGSEWDKKESEIIQRLDIHFEIFIRVKWFCGKWSERKAHFYAPFRHIVFVFVFGTFFILIICVHFNNNALLFLRWNETAANEWHRSLSFVQRRLFNRPKAFCSLRQLWVVFGHTFFAVRLVRYVFLCSFAFKLCHVHFPLFLTRSRSSIFVLSFVYFIYLCCCCFFFSSFFLASRASLP